MASLTIPDAGLHLESSAKLANALPLQAFGITLSDSMIEDLIRSVQDGEDVGMVMGPEPHIEFGDTIHHIDATPDSFGYDLFLTNVEDSATLAQRLPHPTQSLWKRPTKHDLSLQSEMNSNAMSRSSSSSGPESEKSGISTSFAKGPPKSAKHKSTGAKGSTKLLPPGRSAMSAAISGSTLPASPALSGVSSPNPAISASQQQYEKNKEQRSVLVHELAARDRKLDYLEKRWSGESKDLRPTLEKVANFEQSSNSWALKKLYWKELDVWNYSYDTPGDRQAAIDNAVRQYDKQRIGTTSPEWEKLLAPEERGKGKTLSKLQATLAKGNITPVPKVSVQKADDGNKSEADAAKPSKGGEPLVRSSSQASMIKTKKTIDHNLPPRKILSTTTAKKPIPPKKQVSKVKAIDDKGKKAPLSEEFVYDSSSSQDDVPSAASAPAAKSKTAEKPKERPVEKPVERVREKDYAPPVTTAPKPKPVVRAPRPSTKPARVPSPTPQKRGREDEDSSSSSGAPLSKRLKPKETTKPQAPRSQISNKRPPETSQPSRVNGNATTTASTKAKNTSPTKSSPLASSPPTNASDFDDRSSQSQGYAHPQRDPVRNGVRVPTNGDPNRSLNTMRKRKERDLEQDTGLSKKPRVSKDVLKRANLFTKFYERYEALHREIVGLDEPPQDKLADLLDMRQRLVTMKTEISREVAASA